jgi:hypothetical protein
MKPHTKHVLICIGLVVGAFIVWEIIKTVMAGVTDAESLIMAPWNGLKNLFSTVSGAADEVGGDVSAAASLPGLADTSEELDSQLQTVNTNAYAPGGATYNQIQATQGTAAADAAWAKVQSNLSTQESQTSSWWNIFS